jgi:hypothetical protein
MKTIAPLFKAYLVAYILPVGRYISRYVGVGRYISMYVCVGRYISM